MSNATTVLLCGVGGQGTILAADLLAHAALESGYDAKVSEIHGMSQRGGAVTTIVRFGDDVSSMVTDPGSADYIIAFETTEALRNAPYLKQGGMLLVNDESIKPLPVLTGSASMPERARERLCELGAVLVPAGAIAKTAGNAKSTNVVLLGALASGMDFDLALWEDQIAKRVPAHTIDANLAAFRAGAEAAQGVKA